MSKANLSALFVVHWGVGSKPKAGVWEYLKSYPKFEIDRTIQHKLLITVAPDGYLKKIKQGLFMSEHQDLKNPKNTAEEEEALLSILIPTRNRAYYLPFAIQSALNIPSDRVEIIVSENYSQDDSWDVCSQFSDPRLKIVRPPHPLPMHENWEFLLNLSRGRWVTFIGDDDAIMPHCLDHLSWLSDQFPHAEAIVSPRAYYFWDGCQELYGNIVTHFHFDNDQFWVDSKKQLSLALQGDIDYIELPQMYSGGFQRRSLINRVKQSQGGIYFKSVTPDAYSALMACLHTYRYLKTLIPMTWVGSSPSKELKSSNSNKDRNADFWGMHNGNSLTIHQALVNLKSAPFALFLYEAYLAAFPLTSPQLLSQKKIKSLFIVSADILRDQGREDAVVQLAYDLGFEDLLKPSNVLLWLIVRIIRRSRKILLRAQGKSHLAWRRLRKHRTFKRTSLVYRSNSYLDHPDILASNQILRQYYQHYFGPEKHIGT